MKVKAFTKGLAATLVGSLLFVVGTANAFLIDFTSDVYLPIENVNVLDTFSTITSSGLEVILDGNGDALTFNSFEAPGAFTAADGAEFAGLGDGIGLVDDEIGGTEVLTVSFAPSVKLNSIYLLDLFVNGSEFEVAQFDITSDGGVVDTSGIFGVGNNIGFVSWSTLGLNSVLTIDFTASSIFIDQTDFALAGLDVDVAPVPEPATMLLFGTGLAGLAGVARRRKAPKKN